MAGTLESWLSLHGETQRLNRLCALHDWATMDLFAAIYESFEGSCDEILLKRDETYVKTHRDIIMRSWKAGKVSPSHGRLFDRHPTAAFVRGHFDNHVKFTRWIRQGMASYGMICVHYYCGSKTALGFPADFVATHAWYIAFVASVRKDVDAIKSRLAMMVQ